MNEGRSDTTGRKKWTILIYLAGDNDLAEDMVRALHDIDKHRLEHLFRLSTVAAGADNGTEAAATILHEPVSLLDQVNVLAQFDSSGVGVPVVRYDITQILRDMWRNKGLADSEAEAPSQSVRGSILEPDPAAGLAAGESADEPYSLGELNTGASETLRQFIEWGKREEFDAEYRMLILSGHGSGAIGDFLMADMASADSLTIPELVDALGGPSGLSQPLEECEANLAQGVEPGSVSSNGLQRDQMKFDVIGMDACSMSTGEVMFALIEHTDYFVGAEGMEPLGGWPFRQLIETLLSNSNLTPEQLSRQFVQEYIRYYRPLTEFTSWAVDMAACRLSAGQDDKGQPDRGILPVRLALNQLGHDLGGVFGLSNPGRKELLDRVILAHWRAQSYKCEEYVDLMDFCQVLRLELEHSLEGLEEAAGSLARDILTAIGSLKKAIADSVKLSCFRGPAYQHSHGISIYFPWSELADGYRCLAAVEQWDYSPWANFLNQYVEHSRREPRACQDWVIQELENWLEDGSQPSDKVLQWLSQGLLHRDEELAEKLKIAHRVLSGGSQPPKGGERLDWRSLFDRLRKERLGGPDPFDVDIERAQRRLDELIARLDGVIRELNNWLEDGSQPSDKVLQWLSQGLLHRDEELAEKLKIAHRVLSGGSQPPKGGERLDWWRSLIHRLEKELIRIRQMRVERAHTGIFVVDPELVNDVRNHVAFIQRHSSRLTPLVSRLTPLVSRGKCGGCCSMKNPPRSRPRCCCPPTLNWPCNPTEST